MMGMRNSWFTVLCLVFLGWATACAGTEEMMGQDEMMTKEDTMAKDDKMAADDAMSGNGMMETNEETQEMRAMLMGSDGHHATGKVYFGMGMNSTQVLTLSDIKVDKVPDGYVYLAKGGDWMHGVQVGRLKQFSGTVSFNLPAGVDPHDYDTLVIWCKKFKVEIGRATFGKKMM